MTTVLLEPFDTAAAWSATPTLRTGRTGIGLTVTGSNTSSYTIAAGSESDTAIVGFAYRIDTLAAPRSFVTLRSDAGATNHVSVTINTDGSVDVKRGGTAGSVIGSSAPAGTIAINTWYFVELRAVLSDTVGAFSLRVNGSVVASGTNVDTKNLGTKTTFDTLTLQGGGSGSNNTYDDLYLLTGSAETFRGDVAQGSCNDVLREPFEALTNWVLSGTTVPTIGAGRTNNAMRAEAVGTATYTIPSGSEAYEVTIGFALYCAGNLSTTDFLWFKSDAGATDHLRVRVGATGGLSVLRGGTSISGASSATGVIVLSTWQYVEVQVIVHDTAGSITIRVNGTVVMSTTNVDTKNAGTKSTIDTIQLNGIGSGSTNATGAYFDDLYLLTGTTCAFLGDITIGASPTGTAAMVFGGTATGVITFPGTGTATVVFGASATGAIPSFSGAGQANAVFGATATGVVVFSASGTAALTFSPTATSVLISFSGGTAAMVFGGSASPTGIFPAAGQADMVFGATAVGLTVNQGAGTAAVVFTASAVAVVITSSGGTAAVVFSATATGHLTSGLIAQVNMVFTAGPADSIVIPAGTALAVASMTFYAAIREIDFRPIGKATVISSSLSGPVSYQSAPWAPAPGALLGLLMVVPVMQDDIESGPGPATIFATDTFGGTSDWTVAVDYLGHSALGAVRALWRFVVMYATAGPNPLPGTVTISPAVSAPGYLDRSSSYGPYFDHHAVFFELRGQSRQPLGRVGLAQSGSFEVTFGEPITYDDPPADQVTVFMGDSPLDPSNDVGLPVAPSSLVLGLVHQALDQQAQVLDATGSIPITPTGPLAGGKLLAPVPPFTMSAAPGFATFLADPPAADGWDTSHVLMAYRNGIAQPTSKWLGETAQLPWIDPEDPAGDTYGWKVQYKHPQQPLIALAVEFRSAVLDPVPPVVTEFGVWIQGAGGVWIDRTCDIRSIEIERGRSTYSDGFSAATLSLSFANFEGVYSAWNPHSIWALYGGKYQAGVPIQVWGYTGGVATAMFTGTTDSVVDTFPGTVDALSVVQSTDAFKGFARHSNLALPANGFVGTGEYSGQRIHRLATDAGWTGPRAIDTGWTRMQATTMEGNTMDKMREVGESEWGWMFIDEAGTLVFRQRDALQTDPRMTEAQWVFADSHDVPGTLPVVCYQEPLEFSVDEASIINIAQIQNATVPTGSLLGENGTHTATDPPSRAHYGPRTWTRTLPIHDGALGVAQVVVMEYGDDDKHIQALTFNALLPGHRDAAVNIRINDRIKVYRHYPGGFLLKQDLLVQGIHHSITPSGTRANDPSKWDVTVRTATAALIFGFGHWDDPTIDADGNEHGWDVDQWGI